MKKIRRKLLLSFIMIGVTVMTLASTTFAWFVKNREAWTDEFNVEIDVTEGLLVSIDGTSFSQEIKKEQIIEVLEANAGCSYEQIRLNGSTLAHEENKIKYRENRPVFLKDALTAHPTKEDYYVHQLIDSNKNEYIMFDLYFKVVTTGASRKDYKLKFHESSYLRGEEVDVPLYGSLNTMDKEYQANETITINPENAMRIGVVYEENESLKMNVYEPHLGLGSSAIEGRTEDKYDKNKNAMWTYYNSVHQLEKFETAAQDGEGFNTIETLTTGDFGIFHYNETVLDYNTIKVSIYIWLEGWDADYFMGAPITNIRTRLGFVLEDVVMN